MQQLDDDESDSDYVPPQKDQEGNGSDVSSDGDGEGDGKRPRFEEAEKLDGGEEGESPEESKARIQR
jgi:hypothetical protein